MKYYATRIITEHDTTMTKEPLQRSLSNDDDASTTTSSISSNTATETVNETVEDNKLLGRAGLGFLAGTVLGATVTRICEKRKYKKQENKRLAAVKAKQRRAEHKKLYQLQDEALAREKANPYIPDANNYDIGHPSPPYEYPYYH